MMVVGNENHKKRAVRYLVYTPGVRAIVVISREMENRMCRGVEGDHPRGKNVPVSAGNPIWIVSYAITPAKTSFVQTLMHIWE